MTTEKIWYQDIQVLVDPRKLNKFIPNDKYTRNEKLNSVMRLSLYLSIILSLTTFNLNYFFISIVTGLLTYIVIISVDKEEDKSNKKNIEKYEDLKEDKDYLKRKVDIKEYVNKCSLPTNENPFMNFMVSDKRDKKIACKTYNNKKYSKIKRLLWKVITNKLMN